MNIVEKMNVVEKISMLVNTMIESHQKTTLAIVVLFWTLELPAKLLYLTFKNLYEAILIVRAAVIALIGAMVIKNVKS